MIRAEPWYREASLEREFEETMEAYGRSEDFQILLRAIQLSLRLGSGDEGLKSHHRAEVVLALMDLGMERLGPVVQAWNQKHSPPTKMTTDYGPDQKAGLGMFHLWVPKEEFAYVEQGSGPNDFVAFLPLVSDTLDRQEPTFFIGSLHGSELRRAFRGKRLHTLSEILQIVPEIEYDR